MPPEFTLQDHGYMVSHASDCVPVYTPALTGTNWIYPWRYGQAESTWLAGYILTYWDGLHVCGHQSKY